VCIFQQRLVNPFGSEPGSEAEISLLDSARARALPIFILASRPSLNKQRAPLRRAKRLSSREDASDAASRRFDSR